MAEEVNLPKVGKMNKKVIIPVVGVAAVYVGYRYWQARNTPSDIPADDPAYEDAGTLPGVTGAVKDDNSYGGNTGGTGDAGTNDITTNSEWTRFAIQELSSSGRWDSGDIAIALGNFLDKQPLPDDQQAIVRAAIGVAGYPPVGSYSVITGGNTDLKVAPSGVVASGITNTSATISFLPVAGAVSYQVFRNGAAGAVATGTGTSIKVEGLTPSTKYTVQVAGVTKAGTVGPKSSPAPFSTTAAVAVQPSQPKVESVTRDRATLSTGSSAPGNAVQYKWFLNGKLANSTSGSRVTLTNLSPNTAYLVTVATVTNAGTNSHSSVARSFRTPKK